MARAADVAAILEAAYAADLDESSWLRGVLERAAPRLDVGCGVMGFTAQLGEGEHRYGAVMLTGGDAAWQRDWRSDWWDPFMAGLDTASLRGLLEFGPVSSAALLWDAVAAARPTLDAQLRALGTGRRTGPATRDRRKLRTVPPRAPPDPGFRFPDSLNVVAIEGGGAACALVANRPRVLGADEIRKQRTELSRIAAHLVAALRLRRRLGRGMRTDDGEAIIDPRTGAIVHAAGTSGRRRTLDALQRAARDVDRARSGSRRHSADEALALWRCLVERRWTLADVFESDGRRFVVAIPNAPDSRCTPLTGREAQVVHVASFGRSNKEIAYELGLAPTTVATLLGRAARKLGVRNATELIVRARSLHLRAGDDDRAA